MSPKPADLESMIEALRQELPSPEQVYRAHRRMKPRRTSRSSLSVRLALAGLAAGAITYVVWPRESTGSAWARTLESMNDASIVHTVSYASNGAVASESWISGHKRAIVMYSPKDHSVWSEQRTDGLRDYIFFEAGLYQGLDGKSTARLPNARAYGTVRTNPSDFIQLRAEEFEFLDQVLQGKGTVVKSKHDIDTPEGKRTLYDIEMSYVVSVNGKKQVLKSNELAAYVEPNTHRIRRIQYGNGGYEVIDYPNAVPENTFQPAPQAFKNVEFHDLDADQAAVKTDVAHGVRSRSGVTLRLVALDATGNLWVLWTGAPLPDGRLSRPFRVNGVRAGAAFGPRAFTTKFKMDKVSGPAPSLGTRLGGMSRPLLDKVRKTVGIEVPAYGRYIRFDDVPIRRIANIGSFAQILGMRRR